MAIKCDICDAYATMHICDRCYNIAKRLLEVYEEKSKVKVEIKPKKKRGRPPKKDKKSKKILDVEIKPSKKTKPKDPILKSCWTCTYGFINKDGGVSCTEGKDPKTCGQK